MFKTLLKIIASFFLVMIVVFSCAGIWFSMNASKQTELAQPYLEKTMPAVVSWDFDQLRPLLTPESLTIFESERGQKTYQMFSKLGALKSFDEPEFISDETGATVGEAVYDIVIFSIQGHFEAGDALFTMTLATSGDSYLIHYININSNVFSE